MTHTHEEAEPNELKKDAQGRVYREHRCPKCRTLLFDEYIYSGRIKIKCPNCGTISVMVFRHKKPETRSIHSSKNKEVT